MSADANLDEILTEIYKFDDNEMRVEELAVKMLGMGPEGVERLIDALKKNSGIRPKLTVGILNAFASYPDHYALEKLSLVLNEGSLADDDGAYILSILGRRGGMDQAAKKQLVNRLKRVKDPVDRSEILAETGRSVTHDRFTRMAEEWNLSAADAPAVLGPVISGLTYYLGRSTLWLECHQSIEA